MGDKDNVLKLMENHRTRAFSLRKIFPNQVIPPTLSSKQLNTDEFCIILMDEFQRELFRKFPYNIMIDSTHCTNKSRYNLIGLVVIDERAEGVTIMHCITGKN